MNRKRKDQRSSSCMSRILFLFVGVAGLLVLTLSLYRPDSRLPTIVPGTSSGPAFVVQVIRPREGLPLGGLLPPGLFGVDAQLGFDSESGGAAHSTGNETIELGADGWELRLVLDSDGQVTQETEIVFTLVFEERKRKVRCRPGDPVIGKLKSVQLKDSGELSGWFDIELSVCEDAETGKSLGWPAKPFILHGSFDRLPVESSTK